MQLGKPGGGCTRRSWRRSIGSVHYLSIEDFGPSNSGAAQRDLFREQSAVQVKLEAQVAIATAIAHISINLHMPSANLCFADRDHVSGSFSSAV